MARKVVKKKTVKKKTAVAKRETSAISFPASAFAPPTQEERKKVREDTKATMPVLKLLQSMSAEVQRKEFEVGMYLHTGGEGTELGEDVVINIIKFFKTRVLFPPIDSKVKDIICFARDGKQGNKARIISKANRPIYGECLSCALKDWGGTRAAPIKPVCTETLNYLCLVEDHLDLGPAVLRMSSTHFPIAVEGFNKRLDLEFPFKDIPFPKSQRAAVASSYIAAGILQGDEGKGKLVKGEEMRLVAVAPYMLSFALGVSEKQGPRDSIYYNIDITSNKFASPEAMALGAEAKVVADAMYAESAEGGEEDNGGPSPKGVEVYEGGEEGEEEEVSFYE